jgi:hypothetical protein
MEDDMSEKTLESELIFGLGILMLLMAAAGHTMAIDSVGHAVMTGGLSVAGCAMLVAGGARASMST